MTRFTALSLALALASVGTAQSPVPDTLPIPWANKIFLPDIESNPTLTPPVSVTHDFGTIPHGTILTHTFPVTNIYDVPLQITDVRLSCGCLKASPPQRVLQPRETATFTVTMDTSKFTGPNVQLVYATVGPRFTSTAVLRLVANSRPDVALSEPGSLDFGVVPAGVLPTKTVTIDYTGRQRGWAVTGVAAGGTQAVDVSVKPLGRNKFVVTGTLKGEAGPGSLDAIVSLTTNDPATPVVPVPIRGVVQAPVQAAPEQIDVAEARVGTLYTQRILIRGNGSEAFRVDPVQDSGDGVSVETLGVAAPVQAVTLQFIPTTPGPFRKVIPIRTSLNGGTTVTVTLSATVAPASSLPPSINR